jgi:glycosyltransferase involved in cell wall biosynthesis
VAPFRRPNPRPVLEAMAMARPVVAAPAALGGYREQIEQDLWLAGDPVDFAHAVLAALHPPLGTAVGRAARARVLASHSWEAGLARLDGVLEGRVIARPERARPMTLG